MHVWGYVHMTSGTCGGQKMLNPLEMELQVVMMCFTWVPSFQPTPT